MRAPLAMCPLRHLLCTLPHVSSSTQVLFDRLWHVDVLEWLWWLNSHNGVTYDNMLGDKDTYRLAFALANKLPEYQQVKLPPRDAMVKLEGGKWLPGIHYKHQGMVQHTPDEKPAFLHRTGGCLLLKQAHEFSTQPLSTAVSDKPGTTTLCLALQATRPMTGQLCTGKAVLHWYHRCSLIARLTCAHTGRDH